MARAVPEREVVLLRGVNVGGRKLAMAAWRDALAAAGCTEVATYIQSGNAVVVPPSAARGDRAAWHARVATEAAGYDVAAVVRTAADLERTVARNPYPDAGGTQLHVVFHQAPPPPDLLDAIDLEGLAPEHATLVDRDLYLHLPDGMGRARLPTLLERATRAAVVAPATARNWNTVLRLAEMTRA